MREVGARMRQVAALDCPSTLDYQDIFLVADQFR